MNLLSLKTSRVTSLQRAVCSLFGAAFAVLPFVAWSAEPSKIQRFGDWEVICEAPDGGTTNSQPPSSAAGICKAVQRLTVQGSNETVFALSVLPGEKGAYVAIVSVPLGGYVVPGIELTVDNGKPYKLLIETCTAGGCHAGFPLAGRIDKEMRSGKRASFRIWTTKTQSADANVSLNGFADALANLGRLP